MKNTVKLIQKLDNEVEILYAKRSMNYRDLEELECIIHHNNYFNVVDDDDEGLALKRIEYTNIDDDLTRQINDINDQIAELQSQLFRESKEFYR